MQQVVLLLEPMGTIGEGDDLPGTNSYVPNKPSLSTETIPSKSNNNE